MKAKLDTLHIETTPVAGKPNQAMAKFPDQVTVELVGDPSLSTPVAMHHIHLATPDPEKLRAWYVKTFGARAGTRGDFLAAFLPGGEVDTRKTQGPQAPTKGRSLDHIGFEVHNLEAFCKQLTADGVQLEVPDGRHAADGPQVGLSSSIPKAPASSSPRASRGSNIVSSTQFGGQAMPTAVESLPVVSLDYTNRGPGLFAGMTQLWGLLDAESGRDGYLLVNVTVPGALVPVVLARSDLYILGFRCGGSWFRFDDAAWPFSDAASKLGYDGQYRSLGGLTGTLTPGAINGIQHLASISHRHLWKEALRNLLVVVSECSRLVPVQMQVLGLLNGCLPSVSLGGMQHYIQNWDKASKGTDMSKEVRPNLRIGFKDPTIVKR